MAEPTFHSIPHPPAPDKRWFPAGTTAHAYNYIFAPVVTTSPPACLNPCFSQHLTAHVPELLEHERHLELPDNWYIAWSCEHSRVVFIDPDGGRHCIWAAGDEPPSPQSSHEAEEQGHEHKHEHEASEASSWKVPTPPPPPPTTWPTPPTPPPPPGTHASKEEQHEITQPPGTQASTKEQHETTQASTIEQPKESPSLSPSPSPSIKRIPTTVVAESASSASAGFATTTSPLAAPCTPQHSRTKRVKRVKKEHKKHKHHHKHSAEHEHEQHEGEDIDLMM